MRFKIEQVGRAGWLAGLTGSLVPTVGQSNWAPPQCCCWPPPASSTIKIFINDLTYRYCITWVIQLTSVADSDNSDPALSSTENCQNKI